jgi:hypothetical protein
MFRVKTLDNLTLRTGSFLMNIAARMLDKAPRCRAGLYAAPAALKSRIMRN